jgi:excinuclease UvrABC ATPase subunit
MDTRAKSICSTPNLLARICQLFAIAELEPRLFSFNSPMGACTSV